MKLENALFFLVSLFVGVLIWVLAQPENRVEDRQMFERTLELRGLPDGLVVLTPEREIRFEAIGTREELRDLDTNQVSAFVDLSDVEPGQATYSVNFVPPSTNAEIRVLDSFAELQIERKRSITIDVELETFGDPPSDLRFSTQSIVPSEVTISGPESSIGEVARATVSFDLSLLEPNQAFDLPVSVVNSDGAPLQQMVAEPDRVTVSLGVISAPSQRFLVVEPQWSSLPPLGYRLQSRSVDPPQIEVVGDASVLRDVINLATAPIDLSSVTEDSEFEVGLNLPPGVRSVREIETVTVRVSVAPER